MIEVELPDGTIAEFPEGTSSEVMRSAIQKRFPAQSQASSQPSKEAIGGLGQKFSTEATFGVLPKALGTVAGATRGTLESLGGTGTFRGGFEKGYQDYTNDELTKAAEQELPAASTVAEIGGMLVAPTPFAKAKAIAALGKVGKAGYVGGTQAGLSSLFGEKPEETGQNIVGGGLTGAALEATLGRAGKASKAAIDKLKDMPNLSMGRALGSKSLQGIEDTLAQVPFVGRPITRGLEKSKQDIGENIRKLGGDAIERMDYGKTLTKTASSALDRLGKKTTAAYDKAHSYLPKGEKTFADAFNSLDFLNDPDLLRRAGASPAAENAISKYHKILSGDNLTIGGIKEIRNSIYNDMQGAYRNGDANAGKILGDLRQRLTQDYEENFTAHAGSKAQEAIQSARKASINEKRAEKITENFLGDLEGKESSLATKFLGNLKEDKFDEKGLRTLKAIANPAQFNQLRRQTITQLARDEGGEIDPVKFAKTYGKLSKTAKTTLFTPNELQQLEKVKGILEDLRRKPINPSGTAVASRILATLGAGGTAAGFGYGEEAGLLGAGGLASSLMLANPKLALKAARGVSNERAIEALNKLQARKWGDQ